MEMKKKVIIYTFHYINGVNLSHGNNYVFSGSKRFPNEGRISLARPRVSYITS